MRERIFHIPIILTLTPFGLGLLFRDGFTDHESKFTIQPFRSTTPVVPPYLISFQETVIQ